MDPLKVNIESSWRKALAEEFRQPYFEEIKAHLKSELKEGNPVYPPGPLIFKAFELCPLDQVKVVILGQDPYHNPGEAMGLCFSVPQGKRVPPSLKRIYKEINRDVGCSIVDHGDLTSWAEQGVLLLNAMLTVRHKSAGSHKKIGWQKFTDAVIKHLSDTKDQVIFILWGKFAQSKLPLINQLKHHVLIAAHPSPLARTGFAGCSHFSKTNELLLKMGKEEINWQL